MTSVYYAIGDVHGRDDLLAQLHDSIDAHHAKWHAGRAARLVHLGDYIDRGPDSIAVIDRLMRCGPDTTCLMGNHEAMMLTCTRADDPRPWTGWLANGGGETLRALGLASDFAISGPQALSAALGPARLRWLRALPLTLEADGHLFVHAGIAPGVPLAEQRTEDLLWIRGRFLDSPVDHGLRVVHGHTSGPEPVIRRNRICVDTGAWKTGILTAAVLDGDAPPVFLTATDAPARSL